MNEVDKFLKDVGSDKNDEFKPKDDIFGEDSEKKTIDEPEVEVKKEEKPLPFHKDPKVQNFLKKEIEKAREDFLKNLPPREEKENDEAEEILTRIIGNDTPERVQAIKDFKKYLHSLEEKGAERALRQLEESEKAEQEETEKSVQKLEEGFERIEESYGVDLSSGAPLARKTRNEFIDFIQKISPKDSDGEIIEYPDLEGAFETFQTMSKSSSSTNRAKDLASKGLQKSTTASATEQKEPVNWGTVERMFNSWKK
jgi:hypothetical protein